MSSYALTSMKVVKVNDSHLLLAGLGDGHVCVYDLTGGVSELPSIDNATRLGDKHKGEVHHLVPVQDTDLLYSASGDGEIFLWDLKKRIVKEKHDIDGKVKEIIPVTIPPMAVVHEKNKKKKISHTFQQAVVVISETGVSLIKGGELNKLLDFKDEHYIHGNIVAAFQPSYGTVTIAYPQKIEKLIPVVVQVFDVEDERMLCKKHISTSKMWNGEIEEFDKVIKIIPEDNAVLFGLNSGNVIRQPFEVGEDGKAVLGTHEIILVPTSINQIPVASIASTPAKRGQVVVVVYTSGEVRAVKAKVDVKGADKSGSPEEEIGVLPSKIFANAQKFIIEDYGVIHLWQSIDIDEDDYEDSWKTLSKPLPNGHLITTDIDGQQRFVIVRQNQLFILRIE